MTEQSVAGAAGGIRRIMQSSAARAAGEIAMAKLQSIEHFVVLMLENRSFDNLLGGLYPKSKDFDGVDGSESNTDRSGKVWPLTETPGGDVAGLSVPNPDPGELWQDINVQIFGSQVHGGVPYLPREDAVADMSGFVDSYTDPNGKSAARRIRSPADHEPL